MANLPCPLAALPSQTTYDATVGSPLPPLLQSEFGLVTINPLLHLPITEDVSTVLPPLSKHLIIQTVEMTALLKYLV